MDLRRRVGSVLGDRIAVAAGRLAAAQYAAAAMNLAASVVMARMLGPEDYGRVALASAYPTLVWSFAAVKSASITTRYLTEFRARGEYEKLRAVVRLGYSLDLMLAFLALAFISASAWWISDLFYRQSDLAHAMVIYALSFPAFSLVGTSWAVLSSWERFKCLAFLELLNPALKVVLVLAFLLGGAGWDGAMAGMALSQAATGLAMATVSTRHLRRCGMAFWWRASFRPASAITSELTRFFGWNYLLVTLRGLVDQVPVLLLGNAGGPKPAGYYRLALSIVTVGNYLQASLEKVAYPILSGRLAVEGKGPLRHVLTGWTTQMGLPASILLTLSIPFVPVAVETIFGAGYRPAAAGSQFMMAGSAVRLLFFWSGSYYYAAGEVAAWTKGYALYAVLFLGLLWPVAPRYGFSGAAFLCSLSTAVWCIVMARLAFRSLKVSG